jgi:hypothetical protein
VTSTSSRSLLGRGGLRGTLGHQTIRVTLEKGKTTPLLQAGVCSILQLEKGGWRGLGFRKSDCKGGMREGAGHYQGAHWGWTASRTCCFSDSFNGGRHACIVPVFLNTPACQAFCYICVYVCVCVCVTRGITGLLSAFCWPGMM